MKKTILNAVLMSLIIISSCKKPDTPIPAPSILGKWSLINYAGILYANGIIIDSEFYTGTLVDYLDFRSDGKVYSYIDDEYETAPYKINNNKVLIQDKEFKIESLTDKSCTLYLRDPETGTTYTEMKINLKR